MRLRWLAGISACMLLAGNGIAEPASSPQPGASVVLDQAVASVYLSGNHDQFAQAAAMLETYMATHPADLAKRKILGFTYLDKLHNPAKALPHLRAVVDALPNDEKWLQLYARALDETGDHQQAADVFAKCAGLGASDAWVRYQWGESLAKLNRHSDAAVAYASAVAIDQKSAYLRVALAGELVALGRIKEALDAIAPVRQDPGAKGILALTVPGAPKPQSPLERAVAAAYQSKDRAKFLYAAKLLEVQLRTHPDDLADRKTLAFTYLDKLGDPRAALPHLQRVVEALPRDDGWREYLAKAYDATGDFHGAAMEYQRAAELAPHDWWACYELGAELNKSRQSAQAEAAFREGLARDPKNEMIRMELGHLLLARGHYPVARAFAAGVARDDPRNADADAFLGDMDRIDFHFSAARAEYQLALKNQGDFAVAQQGLATLALDERMQLKVSYYWFQDTSDLRQSGIFTYFTPIVDGPLELSVFANELFFKRMTNTFVVDGVTYGTPPSATLDRNENGLNVLWRTNHWLQIGTGFSDFTVQAQNTKFGGSAAIYASPAAAWNASVSYRLDAPVNDSYITASDGYTQDVAAGSVDFRFTRSLSADLTGDIADYSDHNTRRDGLASLAYTVLPNAWLTARLEGVWLDFAHGTSNYPSPGNSTLFRPVLETAPQLTKWLSLDVRGELPYVVQDSGWGTDIVAGFHILDGDWFDLSFYYLRYIVPDFQTNYTGSGFKVEFASKF